MGLRILDQYSLLHLAVGIIAYFWSIPLFILIIIHILFEFIENTPIGMNFINSYLIRWWPGGKSHPDNLLNKSSDVIFSGIGWIISKYIDDYYSP